MKALEWNILQALSKHISSFGLIEQFFVPRFKKLSPIYSRDKSKRLTDHSDVLSR